MLSINILESYKRQKEGQKSGRKNKARKNGNCRTLVCGGCVHSSRLDSDLNEVFEDRVYCSRQDTIVKPGTARFCPFFSKRKRGSRNRLDSGHTPSVKGRGR